MNRRIVTAMVVQTATLLATLGVLAVLVGARVGAADAPPERVAPYHPATAEEVQQHRIDTLFDQMEAARSQP